jgi:hypothetical protein
VPVCATPEWIDVDGRPGVAAVDAATRQLLAVEQGTTFVAGTFSGGTTFTLPAADALADMEFTFYCNGGEDVVITPAGIDSLRDGGTVGDVTFASEGTFKTVAKVDTGKWAVR